MYTYLKIHSLKPLSVLKNFRGYHVIDARDIIFALADMACDGQDPVLIPDYGLSVEEIYSLVTYSLFTKYGFNIILCGAGLQHSTLSYISS